MTLQAYTHFLSSVVLAAAVRAAGLDSGWPPVVASCALSFVAHVPVDVLAKATYHPPKPRPRDPFWMVYHLAVAAASVLVAVWFWHPYWPFMLSGVLVDAWDWGVLRAGKALSGDADWGKGLEFHRFVDRIRERWCGLLPDWNHSRRGVLPEVALVAGLVVAAWLLGA